MVFVAFWKSLIFYTTQVVTFVFATQQKKKYMCHFLKHEIIWPEKIRKWKYLIKTIAFLLFWKGSDVLYDTNRHGCACNASKKAIHVPLSEKCVWSAICFFVWYLKTLKNH